MRFRPEQHLRRQGEIRAVREQGRRIDCRAFTVWWHSREAPTSPASAGSPAARVCFIASRHAVGIAVQRNRAKRRLREVFRLEQQRVPAGCDLLLIARAPAATWPIAELQGRFSEACGKISSTSHKEPA
jgi:ribonuclease P protein component